LITSLDLISSVESPTYRWDTVGRRLERGPGSPAEFPRTPLGLAISRKQVPFHLVRHGIRFLHNPLQHKVIKDEPWVLPRLASRRLLQAEPL
jgi:hypothetical protein